MLEISATFLASADAVVDEAWRSAWALPAPLTVSEWAAKHRKLTQGSANEWGDWRNERTPYLIEIMDRMSVDDPCERVVVRKPTQWGGTEVLVNALGYWMCHAPVAPMMLVVPGLAMAKRHVKQRIDPSIAASDEWKKAVAPKRSRDSSNTATEKEFRGSGLLVIATANSSTDLRAMPVAVVFGDEVSKWKMDVDGEGSSLELVRARTSSFQGSRKELLISSPTIEGACQITYELMLTDWCEYHVPCPHCDGLHTWEFEQLGDDGLMLCPLCGKQYDESHKTSMLAAGRWIPRQPERAKYGHGYDSNALYTAERMGDSWVSLAEQRARAAENPDKAPGFWQMKKAKPFAGVRERAEEDVLKGRAELGWVVGDVPRGYYILTAGVDCQHDRFAVKVVAWSRGQRAAVISYEEIPGDPSSEDGYAELDAHLQRTYAKGNVLLVPKCVAIDGGNWTEQVAAFVRTRERRMVQCGRGYAEQFVVLCRGRSAETDRVVNRPRKAETSKKGKTIARSVGVWGVGTKVAKNVLFGRIASDGRKDKDGQAVPVERRFVRWPGGRRSGEANGAVELTGALPTSLGGTSHGYFKGLTAEAYDQTLDLWVHDKRIPNEPIDTLVYAYFAALHPHVRLDLIKEHEWAALAEAQEPAMADLFGQLVDALSTASRAAAAPAKSKPDTENGRQWVGVPTTQSQDLPRIQL